MRIILNGYQHYTEEDGMTEHNLICIRKNEQVPLEELVKIAHACNAAFVSNRRFRQRHIKRSPYRTLQQELFAIHIKGGDEKKCSYTLLEL
jgi:hypothetical protein